MKKHTISLTGRGDICARSYSIGFAPEAEKDPEFGFELELAQALAEAEVSADELVTQK